MTVNELLNDLEDLVDSAWALPLSGGKAAIPVENVQKIIDEIRISLPKEVRQSKMIVADRKDIIDDAKKEAEKILADSEKRAQRLVNENEITKQAQTRANKMLAQAQSQTTELRRITNEYVDNLLSKSEATLAKTTNDLKAAHNEVRQIAKKSNKL